MFSKVLLLVLVSCTLTLASPVHRSDELSNEENYPINEEVKEAVEDILIKVSQAVNEILETLTKQIEQGFNSEDLKQSVEKLEQILEKSFNTNEDGESPSEQEIQKAVNEAIKNICEVFKGIFEAFFRKVQEKFNDEELEKSIEHLKIVLRKIFNYDVDKEKRSRSAPTSEEMSGLTNTQLEKVGENLRGLLQDLFEQMLENSGEELSSEETEIVKSVLEELSGDQTVELTKQ